MKYEEILRQVEENLEFFTEDVPKNARETLRSLIRKALKIAKTDPKKSLSIINVGVTLSEGSISKPILLKLSGVIWLADLLTLRRIESNRSD